MQNFFHTIGKGILALGVALSSLFGVSAEIPSTPVQAPQENVGASLPIPTTVALFETSLAAKITNTAISMTLVSALDKEGNALASSTYAFIIDEGTASEEMVIADCTGTTCTNMTRGISVLTGTSTVTSLRKAHNRGASVKITDGPQLMILSRIVNGIGTFPNILSYNGAKTPTVGAYNIPDWDFVKSYVDSGLNQGAATSTESNGGLVELGTLAEQASSYDGGSNKPTVLQTKNSTSTCQVVGSYNVVASTTTGKIDKGCIDQTADYTLTGNSTFTGQNSFTGTTTMATTTQNGAAFGGNITNTFTGGQSLTGATSPQPVMMATSTGLISLIDSDLASTSAPLLGFVINNCGLNTTCYVQTDGIVKGFSGLTAGREYYVSDTGTLSTTIGTTENYVGRAVSTSAIQIERRENQYLGSATLPATVPQWARYAVINATATSNGVCTGMTAAQFTLYRIGVTSSSAAVHALCGGSSPSGSISVSWSGATISGTFDQSSGSGGTSGAAAGTVYFYK